MFIKFSIAIATAIILAVPVCADAIPAFSKKYDAPCSMCHNSWPRLNDMGVKFKINGYQLPDSEDGGKRAKLSPSDDLFLDIGSANPPVSIRLEGGLGLLQPSSGPDGAQEDKFFCCVEGNAVTLNVGATLAPNISAWLSLPWGKETVAQGYLRFVNLFGPGMLGLDIGSMKVVDYDVIGSGREWFGAPWIAFYGSPSNPNSREVGLTAPHNDTGVRLYGRPGLSHFTYEASAYTGSHITGAGDDDHELAYTFMGRADVGAFAVSMRYWGNKSGKLDQQATSATGEALVFSANPSNTDENTQEFIISARYLHPYFAVDFTMDRTSFSLGDRTMTSSGVAHTLSQGTINRAAFSLGAIWFINNWLETGVAYGTSKYDDYSRSVDGVASTISGVSAGLAQWRILVRPTMNMTVGLDIQLDVSDSSARKLSDGTSFDAQNKILLQWDLAL